LCHFDAVFFKTYSKDIERGIRNVKDMRGDFMPTVIAGVQNWVRIVFFATLRFYRLNLQPPKNSFGDVRKDLLLNMITSQVMMDQTYSIIMNSILQNTAERVRDIQKNMARYRFKVNLEKLGVSKYFWFNTAFREAVIKGQTIMDEELQEMGQ
jgi:hypothetical protein